MGLTEEDYKEVTDMLVDQLPDDIYCDKQRCLLKQKCESYSGQIPDLKLKISNRADFTVKGDDLLASKSVIDHTGEYLCEVLLFNSNSVYTVGSAMLKDYYAVYDIEKFKVGLGKVVDFDYVPPSPQPDDED